MTAKDYLKQCKRQHDKLTQISDRIIELSNNSYTPTLNYGEPRAHNDINDTVSKRAVKLETIREQYIKEHGTLIDTWESIDRKIDGMPEPLHRLILLERYILLKSWHDIAVSLDYSIQQCYRLHGEALLEFERLYIN